MIPYRIQEADLSIPDTWTDQSINIFKIPATEHTSEASFVISRDATQKDPFPDYIAGQITAAGNALSGFKLLQREDFDRDGTIKSDNDISGRAVSRSC